MGTDLHTMAVWPVVSSAFPHVERITVHPFIGEQSQEIFAIISSRRPIHSPKRSLVFCPHDGQFHSVFLLGLPKKIVASRADLSHVTARYVAEGWDCCSLTAANEGLCSYSKQHGRDGDRPTYNGGLVCPWSVPLSRMLKGSLCILSMESSRKRSLLLFTTANPQS